MKEKPILFSTPMVKALLNTKPGVWPAEEIDSTKPFKSMTRRVILPQPDHSYNSDYGGYDCLTYGYCHLCKPKPKYQIDDILWVRETVLQYESIYQHKIATYYKADNENQKSDNFFKWKPSIFMPRKAARIF